MCEMVGLESREGRWEVFLQCCREEGVVEDGVQVGERRSVCAVQMAVVVARMRSARARDACGWLARRVEWLCCGG